MNLDIDHLQQIDSGHEYTWVRRLTAAILYRAILDAAAFSLGRKRGYNYTGLDGVSGWNYVMSPERRWPLCFESLCLHFDLDPDRVRQMVRHSPDGIFAARAQGRNDLLPKLTTEFSDAEFA